MQVFIGCDKNSINVCRDSEIQFIIFFCNKQWKIFYPLLTSQCWFTVSSLSILDKKVLSEVLSHATASSHLNRGRPRIMLAPIYFFMRVIEILIQLVRHWRLSVFIAQNLLSSPRKSCLIYTWTPSCASSPPCLV